MILSELDILLYHYGFMRASENFLEYKRTTEKKFYKVIIVHSDNISIEEYDILEKVKDENDSTINKCILVNVISFIESDELIYLRKYLSKLDMIIRKEKVELILKN